MKLLRYNGEMSRALIEYLEPRQMIFCHSLTVVHCNLRIYWLSISRGFVWTLGKSSQMELAVLEFSGIFLVTSFKIPK